MTKDITITAIALDPIYIGTGGYTIGRVDNTIVRDPITNLPKIPWSSLAWTWRYYSALKLIDNFDKSKQCECCENDVNLECNDWKSYWWCGSNKNLKPSIKCAWQDEASTDEWGKTNDWTGHCWHCIVCHSFWFSKKDLSYQWRLFFSDLQIFAFPVSTYRWIYWVINPEFVEKKAEEWKVKTKDWWEINLGYLNFETEKISWNNLEKLLKKDWQNYLEQIDYNIKSRLQENFVIVWDDLFAQIVNANLETRTSVSIDPITGAAKEGALFTSEATPRLTIFVWKIRFKVPVADDKIAPKLTFELVEKMLKDTRDLFKVFGIWGMTTRWFGRLEVEFDKNWDDKDEQQN